MRHYYLVLEGCDPQEQKGSGGVPGTQGTQPPKLLHVGLDGARCPLSPQCPLVLPMPLPTPWPVPPPQGSSWKGSQRVPQSRASTEGWLQAERQGGDRHRDKGVVAQVCPPS